MSHLCMSLIHIVLGSHWQRVVDIRYATGYGCYTDFVFYSLFVRWYSFFLFSYFSIFFIFSLCCAHSLLIHSYSACQTKFKPFPKDTTNSNEMVQTSKCVLLLLYLDHTMCTSADTTR